jgi:hypothetical protein
LQEIIVAGADLLSWPDDRLNDFATAGQRLPEEGG